MQEYKLLNSASCALISDVPVYFYASLCVYQCVVLQYFTVEAAKSLYLFQ